MICGINTQKGTGNMRKIFGSKLMVLLLICALMLSVAIFVGCDKDVGDPEDTSDTEWTSDEEESQSESEVVDLTSYKITYVLNGASSVYSNPKTYTAKDEVILRSPKKDGYVFLGWTYDGQTEPVIEPVIPKGSKGNKTFTANWKMIEYIISFDANGGEEISETISVSFGMEYTLPVPTRVGYAFEGWFSNSIQYKDGTWENDKNLDLVAKWKIDTYTITYNTFGGSHLNPETYTFEEEIVLKAPSRDGYDFVGWTYEGQTEPKKDVAILKGTSGDLYFEAHWRLSDTPHLLYSLNDDGESYRVTGLSADLESITVLSEYNGKPVVEIGENAFSGFSKLVSINIPLTVNKISKNAFENCTALESLVLPGSIRIIERNAFIGCTELSSITIPRNVISIEPQAFNGCSALTTVTFESGSRLESVGSYAFRGCTSLENIVLPEGLKTIGDEAFRRTNIASITIPSSVESVGIGIFSGCNSLVDINVAMGNVDYYVAGNCLIKSEGNVLVAGCKTSNVSDGVLVIAKYAFKNIAIESLKLSSTVTTIEQDAFKDCTSLVEVYYDGTASQFAAITGEGKADITSKCYYYSETEPIDTGKYWHYVRRVITKWDTQA